MEVSLFERLVQEKFPVTVLSAQYRMTPWLALFPSKFFYNDKMQSFRADGSPPWEMWGSPWDVESPVTIIDVSKESKRSAAGSWMNTGEAPFVRAPGESRIDTAQALDERQRELEAVGRDPGEEAAERLAHGPLGQIDRPPASAAVADLERLEARVAAALRT